MTAGSSFSTALSTNVSEVAFGQYGLNIGWSNSLDAYGAVSLGPPPRGSGLSPVLPLSENDYYTYTGFGSGVDFQI